MPAPFTFLTSIHAVQLTGRRASTLEELYGHLQEVEGSSIYHHTYRYLRIWHFLPDITHSDFATWIGENLKEETIAEQITSLDLRDFSSIRDLRNVLLSILGRYRDIPGRWPRPVPPGLEFHFCRSSSIVMPTGLVAHNLEELVAALGQVDVGSLFYHLVEAPLHEQALGFENNELSLWLDRELGLPEEARAIAGLNPYLWDMEMLRGKIIERLGHGKLRTVVERVLARQPESETGAAIRSLLAKWRNAPPPAG